MSSHAKGLHSSAKMKRMISRKSHSWWWDGHISPKNSKWLAENLEEMDRSVKEMLKLIEEEGDSFAKKAEMYYQKRPELISHVEDFYRMYRALAERYDHLTGEVRKNIQSELSSQGSGSGSDFGSEPPSPSLDHRTTEPKLNIPKPAGRRAAGFDFFLGSGGSSDFSKKGSDKSSTSSESDSDSDDTKDLNGDGDDDAMLQRRIFELETELANMKEKLSEHDNRKLANCDHADLILKISSLENDLMSTNEKLRDSEAEIASLTQELKEKILSSETMSAELSDENIVFSRLQARVAELESEIEGSYREIEYLKQELKEKNLSSETISAELSDENMVISRLEARIAELESEIEGGYREIEYLKQELKEKNSSSEAMSAELGNKNTVICGLEARVAELESEIEGRNREIEYLRGVVSSRDQAIEQYKTQLAVASDKLTVEKSLLETDIGNLERVINELKAESGRISREKLLLEASSLEQQRLVQELTAAVAIASDRFAVEKSSLEAEISALSQSNAVLEGKLDQLEAEKTEACRERDEKIAELCLSLDSLRQKVAMLSTERDDLNARVVALQNDIRIRDDRVRRMDEHLHELHMEHVKLLKEIEDARRGGEELRERVKELEEEVERQRAAVSDGAEGKREAIRQLCFSLEHYRDGYYNLLKLLQGHSRRPTTVMAV